MTTPLSKLVIRARETHNRMSPRRNAYIQVLTSLSESEVEEIQTQTTPKRSTLAALARRNSVPVWSVEAVVDRFLRLDVVDYSISWESKSLRYMQSKLSDREFEEYLDSLRHERGETHFLLHDMVCSWKPIQVFLCPVLISDNDFYASLGGYFISVNRAYSTYLDLLLAAYAEQWPSWSSLWDDDERAKATDKEEDF